MLCGKQMFLSEQIRTMYQQMGRSASDEELNAALAAFKQKQAAMIGSIMALQAQAKLAVVNEGPVIKVVTLDDGKEVPVLTRSLGINEFDLTRAADGVLGIRAKMGYSYETVPDIVAAIEHPPLADAAH